MASDPDPSPPPPQEDPFGLPAELICQPLALVALLGLDPGQNQVHQTIWEAFSLGRPRPDRPPLHFRLLQRDHAFPPAKAKKSSYEWYVPRGILKTNWMCKHLHEIPSVAVIFFDLDWGERLWAERLAACAQEVQSARSALETRHTRLAVVLIQQSAPLPAGEDPAAAERAAALCQSCDLPAKSLFVLPHSDHLQGYVARLENALYELSQVAYHQRVRRIKAHKDLLNKTIHVPLLVRHQFKAGFVSELRQDPHAAHRHYAQAYAHLMDLRTSDTNLPEVRTVSGFLNYKLCQLAFRRNLPRDALSQFQRHVDVFRTREGASELAFEHQAWMSAQFTLFAGLFDAAVKQGLVALQTQNPGFYYRQAANHASMRHRLCLQLCTDAIMKATQPTSDPLEGLSRLEYYGQRPWRSGRLTLEPPDPVQEKEGILALQRRERSHVQHSAQVVALLSAAMAQFKRFRCPRMRRQLTVQMAQECFNAGEFQKALTLTGNVLWDYRCERWWMLLTSVLELALCCAYLTANVQEYVVLCVEAVGPRVSVSQSRKEQWWANLQRVLNLESPEHEPGCPAGALPAAQEKWEVARNAQPFSVTVELGAVMGFLECRAGFLLDGGEGGVAANEQLEAKVVVHNACSSAVCFSRLSLFLTNPNYLQHCTLEDRDPRLSFEPWETKSFSFLFLPEPQDYGQEMQVTAVVLVLGKEGSGRQALLRVVGSEVGASASAAAGLASSDLYPSIRVAAWDSKLQVKIDQESPALTGEAYPIQFELCNEETQTAAEILMQLSVEEGSEVGSVGLFQEPPSSAAAMDLGPSHVSSRIGDLPSGSTRKQLYFVAASREGTLNLKMQVSYMVELEVGQHRLPCNCTKVVYETVVVRPPFQVTSRLLSMKLENLPRVYGGETFLVSPEVACLSPCPLALDMSLLDPSAPFCPADEEGLCSQVAGLSLREGEVASECLCLQVDAGDSNRLTVLNGHNPGIFQAAPLGTYTITWRRDKGKFGEAVPATFSVTLPSVQVFPSPLVVEMCLPAHGWVRTPMAVSYKLRNLSGRPLSVAAKMEASDAFMFAGNKQAQMMLPPWSCPSEPPFLLSYNLYPLLAGFVALPQLRLSLLGGGVGRSGSDATDYQTLLDALLDRTLPSHVYIVPQAKPTGSFGPIVCNYSDSLDVAVHDLAGFHCQDFM